LNSYRECSGSIVISRGLGTRDLVKSLQNNEIIGMVVDQGGKDGVLVPFFDREASMSVGAIRMGLKRGIPICFSIIFREKGEKHRMVIHPPFELVNTGDAEKDVMSNLTKVTEIMENYIHRYPSEYMWFYKIWKYSNHVDVVMLNDQRTGHLRQSETVFRHAQDVLEGQNKKIQKHVVDVDFKNAIAQKIFSIFGLTPFLFFYRGKIQLLKLFLTKESYEGLASKRCDFVISCGSSLAGVNYFLAKDHHARSIVVQKPGMWPLEKFDLVILPQHDAQKTSRLGKKHVAVTSGAPNLVNEKYLQDESKKLLQRFSHLKNRSRFKIGVLIGGNSKKVFLSEQQIKILIQQIKQVSQDLKADLLITTSRRTPPKIEQMFLREFKKNPSCPLLILASRENVKEAVGGILGLSDIVVVSGDSISMVSEAASSGKYTVVFLPQKKDVLLKGSNKHIDFIENLNDQGFVLSSHVNDISHSIYSIAKNKIQTKPINDDQVIREAMKYVI
ncbi:MAG: mitochondrial fission ELM1 family protein, partial [Candidatus Omnitrophica bacterium]|nr:mitochondrial fission ELM1 family protein [Candidatus Omnitrophota bacterium]